VTGNLTVRERGWPGGRLSRGLRVAAIYLVLGALLWWALRNAPLSEIWLALRALQLWQIALLAALNALIYVLVTARWWLVIRAESKNVSLIPLIGVRVSVFGISYFTLGPQVGGEPVQVLYLQRRYGLTVTHATATVIMDKLLEFLANFALLALGLTAVFQAGILAGDGGPAIASLLGLMVLVTWPLIHLILLYNRIHPLSALMDALQAIHKGGKTARFVRAAEHLAGRFCRRHPRNLLAALAVSLLAAAGIVGEYALMASFLQVKLPFWQMVAAWTAGWLAFLVPLPAGLGALEAGQVFALGMFGYPAPVAIGLVLLIRGRDILIGALGLLMAGHAARRM
jgi:glycosyltransferase 2 family protein